MIVLPALLKKQMQKVKYTAQNAMKHAKLVIIRENQEIINAPNAKMDMNGVPGCMVYAIRYVRKGNFITTKIPGKKNVRVNAQNISHIC